MREVRVHAIVPACDAVGEAETLFATTKLCIMSKMRCINEYDELAIMWCVWMRQAAHN